MHLFGSRARGEHRPNSDVDLFVSAEEVSLIPRELVYTLDNTAGCIDLFLYPDEEGIIRNPYVPIRKGTIKEGVLEDAVEITPSEVIQMAWVVMARRKNPVLGSAFHGITLLCDWLRVNEHNEIEDGRYTGMIADGAYVPGEYSVLQDVIAWIKEIVTIERVEVDLDGRNVHLIGLRVMDEENE